jgi:hypothetical protein
LSERTRKPPRRIRSTAQLSNLNGVLNGIDGSLSGADAGPSGGE